MCRSDTFVVAEFCVQKTKPQSREGGALFPRVSPLLSTPPKKKRRPDLCQQVANESPSICVLSPLEHLEDFSELSLDHFIHGFVGPSHLLTVATLAEIYARPTPASTWRAREEIPFRFYNSKVRQVTLKVVPFIAAAHVSRTGVVRLDGLDMALAIGTNT